MSTTQRKRRGGTTNSRQPQKRERLVGPTTEMTSEAEPIELVESAGEEVVDLTCESTEPVVVDLTHNDSVVFVEENRRQRRNPRISRGQPDSCVLSSDDEETRDNDVYVTENPPRESVVLEEETSSIRFDRDETFGEVSNQRVKLAQELELEVDENNVEELIGSHGEDLIKEHLIELLAAKIAEGERKALEPKVKPRRFTAIQLAEAFHHLSEIFSCIEKMDPDTSRILKVQRLVEDNIVCYHQIYKVEREPLSKRLLIASFKKSHSSQPPAMKARCSGWGRGNILHTYVNFTVLHCAYFIINFTFHFIVLFIVMLIIMFDVSAL